MQEIGCDFYNRTDRLTQDWMDGCGEGYKRGLQGYDDLSDAYLNSDNENERMFGRGMAYGYPNGALMAKHIETIGIPM